MSISTSYRQRNSPMMDSDHEQAKLQPKPAEISVESDRFPFCIVWTAIPLITWIFPFIGHMGIADSRGIIYDFAGPYHISQDDFAFGKPARYLQLQPAKSAVSPDASPAQVWDAAVAAGNAEYCRRMHNLCCDNCHSHVARCLNTMQYDNSRRWNMVWLAAWMCFAGRPVTWGRMALSWAPFIIWVSLLLIIMYA